MSENSARSGRPKPKNPSESLREQRLKAALKANMARRKAQARGRAEKDSDESGNENNENE